MTHVPRTASLQNVVKEQQRRVSTVEAELKAKDTAHGGLQAKLEEMQVLLSDMYWLHAASNTQDGSHNDCFLLTSPAVVEQAGSLTVAALAALCSHVSGQVARVCNLD